MQFHDKKGNDMDTPVQILAHTELFLIAILDKSSDNNIIVGLFMEDDDHYHLQMTFSSYWLGDLEKVSNLARSMADHISLTSGKSAKLLPEPFPTDEAGEPPDIHGWYNIPTGI